MTVSCLTDDGLIDESDLREVMKACMVENGMQFDEKEVASLANALFEDAVQVAGSLFQLLQMMPCSFLSFKLLIFLLSFKL